MKTRADDPKQTSRGQSAPSRDLAGHSTYNTPGRSSQQTSWIKNLNESPRMVLQRQALRATFGDAAQLPPDGLKPQPSLQGNEEVQARAPAATNETGLPDRLKAGIESLSGMDMSDVRVHTNSDKPAQLNALAYAQGSHIHLGPGQEQHLPHEAWHVVQQAQGRVTTTRHLPTGVPVNDDRGLEREADSMGAATLQLSSRADEGSRTKRVLRTDSGPVQRYLIVGAHDLTRMYKEEAEKHTGADKEARISAYINPLINQVASAMINELNPLDVLEKKVIDAIKLDADGKLRSQITKWIEDIPGDKTKGKHPDFGRKNQTRVYGSFKDLALALYGWVKAKPARHEEKEKAREIEANEAIGYHLDSILLKIGAWIDGRGEKDAILAELRTPAKVGGHDWNIYQKYFSTAGIPRQKLPADYEAVIRNPENFSIREKTGTLHDVMHYFMEKRKVVPGIDLLDDVPAGKATVIDASGTIKRENYARPENSQIRSRDAKKMVEPANLPGGTGPNVVKVSNEESHESYRLARFKDIPMYGRHSYTAARMMLIAQKSGGTKEEISALAWSIMAYWRLNYDHTSIPYHTLHEIMDLTPELFGIDYDIDDRFAGLDLFTKDGLIKSLHTSILAQPEQRDIQKLMAVDTPKNVAAFFLEHEALWANATVMTFLKTTVLPIDEFKTLKQDHLRRFFVYNEETKAIFRVIPGDRQGYVLGT